MPVKSPAQWGFMGAVRSGKVPGVVPSVGKEFMEATPPTKRSLFAKASAKKRKRGGAAATELAKMQR